jgi:hypothetical protein
VGLGADPAHRAGAGPGGSENAAKNAPGFQNKSMGAANC